MFRFSYLRNRYTVTLHAGEAKVTPKNSGAQATIDQALDDVSRGKYFPDPDEQEYRLSEEVGGDFQWKPKPPRREDPNLIY